jgi:hypothetical protein
MYGATIKKKLVLLSIDKLYKSGFILLEEEHGLYVMRGTTSCASQMYVMNCLISTYNNVLYYPRHTSVGTDLAALSLILLMQSIG